MDYEESWEYFISWINKQDDINEIEKQELIKNWGLLRNIFGEDWFKKEETKLHPLRSYFYNHAPWCLRWISDLGLGIESLKEKEYFDDILKRILSADTFGSAYCEFQVGYSLFKLNIPFNFLNPFKNKKTPDISINSNGRTMFLEITEKQDPDDPLNSYQNGQKISWFLYSKGNQASDFVLFVDILKPLSVSRTNHILSICEKMLEKAKKSGFEEYHDSKIIDLYIVKKENIEKIPKENRVIQWKPPENNELRRIKGTIKEKESQLRTENPSVLIIFDSFIWPTKDNFHSDIVYELEESVNQYTNLSAVVINIPTFLIDEEHVIKEKKNCILITGYDKKLLKSKNKLIILNEFAKHPLSLEEIELLKKL